MTYRKKITTLGALIISLMGCSPTESSKEGAVPTLNKTSDPVAKKLASVKGFHKISEKDLHSIILGRAKNAKTVQFGEFHYKRNDDKFMLSLLPALKRLGFTYFAKELDTHEQPLIDAYLNGTISKEDLDNKLKRISEYVSKNSNGDSFYDIKSTLLTLEKVHKLGYEVILFDERPKNYTSPGDRIYSSWGTDRDKKQFENIKEKIFDKDPDAKVVVFSGRFHIDESPRYHPDTGANQKALGFFLEQYSDGRNLSVSLVEEAFRQWIFDEGLTLESYISPDLAISIELEK